MFGDLKDFLLGFLLPFLTVIILTCTSIMTLAYVVTAKTCEAQAVSFASSDFSFFGGCMVEYQGLMVPIDMLRINVEEE